MEKKEKSISRIGTYFLVLGVFCASMVPMYFSILSFVGPICIILMCSPRLIYKNNKWSSVLLMIGAILATLALLFFDALLIILSQTSGQRNVGGYIICAFITALVLLNFYMSFRLYKLLFKTKETG